MLYYIKLNFHRKTLLQNSKYQRNFFYYKYYIRIHYYKIDFKRIYNNIYYLNITRLEKCIETVIWM